MSKIQSVLVVDDDRDIRRIAELTLRNVGGWTVLLAASGAEAVEVAGRERPDVILLDVMMPVADGPTTLARLRTSPDTLAIPVIFVTARVQQHEVARYLALGAVGVLAKPFDPMTLATQIEEIVGGRA